LKKLFAETLLGLFGWKKHGSAPTEPRCVLIAAPHTSNWDFPLVILFAAAYGLKIHWLGKHTLFTPLTSRLMRALGGIPVKRSAAHNLVDQLKQEFSARERFILVVPTEGTRSRTEYWKSGFYYIAKTAAVPIVPTFLDFKTKRAGFGEPLWPTADVRHDMQQLRDFYRGRTGRHPGQFGPVRLKEEQE